MALLSGITSLVTTSPTMLAVGAGVLAGAVTGTAVVASGVLSSPAPEQLALMACPASDTVVARVTSGQSMLVTAKSGDGTWLQLYIGEPGIDRGWAPIEALRVSDSLDALPVLGCEVAAAPSGEVPPPTPTPNVTAIVDPTPEPTPLPSGVTPPPPTPTPLPTPTPKPTPVKTLPPGATATPFVATPLPPPPTFPPTAPPPTAPPPTAPPPTPAPDLTKPTITNVAISGAWTSGNGQYYIYAPAATNCPYHSANISATVTDTGGSGLAGYTVTLHWKDPFGNQYNQQMSYSLSTFKYNKTISAVNGWPENVNIEYWITASDYALNEQTTSHPPDGQHWLATGQCLA